MTNRYTTKAIVAGSERSVEMNRNTGSAAYKFNNGTRLVTVSGSVEAGKFVANANGTNYREFMKKFGLEVPSKRTTLTLPIDLEARFAELANDMFGEEKNPRAALLEHLLDEVA